MILSNLNEHQIAAVTHEGHALITACPGSGKTRVLTRRVAYEIYERISNTKQLVAALTFTNRAAGELENRLDRLNIEPKQLWAGTIHAFCLEWILRPYAGYSPNLKKGFSVVDAHYTESTIQLLKEKYGIDPRYQIDTKINKDRSFIDQGQQVKKLLIEYYQTLKENQQINFDLILYLAYKLLHQFPLIVKNLSKIFTLICVDEYQDTQDLQYEIIHQILRVGKGETAIYYVGDTNQAIYDSLGGIAKPKAEIEKETGLVLDELHLPGNYRSTQKIIDYYSNFQVSPLSIHAHGNHKDSESIITYNNSVFFESLPEYIASLIKSAVENEGIDYSEICVLAPQWYPLAQMSRTLSTLLPNMPFDAPGLSPLRRDIENIWYKMTRLVLTEPHPRYFSIRVRWARQIVEELKSQTGSVIPERYLNAKTFLRLINSIHSDEEDGLRYLKIVFDLIADNLGFSISDFPGLKSNFDAFFGSAQRRIDNPGFDYPTDIHSFRKLFKGRKGIVVNSCQGVKGEEYEFVIAFSLIDGKIPHRTTPKDQANSSSKRMIYVIASRAKRFLHLISEIGRRDRDFPTPVLHELAYEYDAHLPADL